MPRYTTQKKGVVARKLLLQGAKEVYDAVSTTLGSRGRNVVTWQNYGRIRVLHDGVKIASLVEPQNRYKNAGANILKQAAQRQVDSVGDGTTVTVVLGYAIAKEALKVVESGVNPMALRKGLERGKDLLVKRIRELSKPLTTKEQKIQVATVSSEDEELGKLIGDTYIKAGIDAVITAEQVAGAETFIDHQEGMQIDRGFVAPHFITNPKAGTASVSEARILVTDYKLNDIHQLTPLINNLVNDNNERNFVVIAEDIEGNVLATLILNKAKGAMNTLAVKAPSFQTEEALQDIATLVGAKFVSAKADTKLKDLTIDDLGFAKRVTSTKDATVISEGGGDPKMLKEKIASLKNQLKEEDSDFQREKLRERLAKLTGGVYVIKVGGHTEIEAEEKTERADDAIRSTKAALEGGIVAGGEVTFLRILDVLKPENEEEEYSYRILRSALKKPFEKLVKNAGINAGEMMAKLEKRNTEFGVDVEDGKIKDMIKEGIIDATPVLIEAIKNAISVAIMAITSDAIVAEIEVREERK